MSNEPSQGKREGAGALATVRSIFSILFTLLLVGASAAGLYNVFGVREEVLALASEAACEGQGAGCKAQLTYFEGSPFSHTYRMSTPKGSVTLTCKRPWISSAHLRARAGRWRGRRGGAVDERVLDGRPGEGGIGQELAFAEGEPLIYATVAGARRCSCMQGDGVESVSCVSCRPTASIARPRR